MTATRRKPGRPRFQAISFPPKPAHPSESVSPSPRRRRLPIIAPSTKPVTLPVRSQHVVTDADIGLPEDHRAQAQAERLIRYHVAARLRDADQVARIMVKASEAAATEGDPYGIGAELQRIMALPRARRMAAVAD